jgi:nicotinamide-nucleotide amidase
MRAEIISIGDEMTSGQRLDTNSQWLAQRLGEVGVPVAFHTTVGDVLADNILVFRHACQRAELVIATGGLGPTADDLTRQALADLAGVPLVQDDASLAHIRSLFARRKREMPPANLVQAQFPLGSKPIPNPHGTAPGIDLEIPRAVGKPARVFALPGVPAEMKEMWQATVAPAVQELLGVRRVISHFRIKCFGVGESDLEAMMPDLIARQRYPLVGITVHQATITLRISAAGETPDDARASMQSTIDTIHECLGDLIFGYEEDELPQVVVRLLAERQQTLAVTEWGTCGLASQWLAALSVPGQFVGGAVHTSPDSWAELSSASLPNADYHLLIGPANFSDPETPSAGTLPVVLHFPGGRMQKEIPYSGHPEILRPRAAKQALNLLRLHVLGKLAVK